VKVFGRKASAITSGTKTMERLGKGNGRMPVTAIRPCPANCPNHAYAANVASRREGLRQRNDNGGRERRRADLYHHALLAGSASALAGAGSTLAATGSILLPAAGVRVDGVLFSTGVDCAGLVMWDLSFDGCHAPSAWRW